MPDPRPPELTPLERVFIRHGFLLISDPSRETLICLHKSGLWMEWTLGGFVGITDNASAVRSLDVALKEALAAGKTGKQVIEFTRHLERTTVRLLALALIEPAPTKITLPIGCEKPVPTQGEGFLRYEAKFLKLTREGWSAFSDGYWWVIGQINRFFS